jgi:hypothetical protein
METMSDDRMSDDQMKPRAEGRGPRAEYDFGAEPDVVPPNDPDFDAWVAKVAPALNAPNTVPKLEMWEAIQAAQKTAAEAQAGRIAGVTPLRRNHWRLMSVIAAALLLGVAIDRFALRPGDGAGTPSADTRVAVSPETPKDSSDPSRLYRMAAAQTLTQAEALLTAYRASGVSANNPVASRQLGSWGREVLSSTRLLLDSPAGDDPQLKPLLNDLELVLVQIIQLSGAPLEAGDRELIDRALQDRDLLPRIRTAVPAGVAGSASDD